MFGRLKYQLTIIRLCDIMYVKMLKKELENDCAKEIVSPTQ